LVVVVVVVVVFSPDYLRRANKLKWKIYTP